MDKFVGAAILELSKKSAKQMFSLEPSQRMNSWVVDSTLPESHPSKPMELFLPGPQSVNICTRGIFHAYQYILPGAQSVDKLVRGFLQAYGDILPGAQSVVYPGVAVTVSQVYALDQKINSETRGVCPCDTAVSTHLLCCTVAFRETHRHPDPSPVLSCIVRQKGESFHRALAVCAKRRNQSDG